MSEIEDNKRLTLGLIDAIGRGDAEFIAASYAADGHLYTMGNTLISGIYDKAKIRQFAGAVLDAFPNGLNYTIHNLTAEQDRVAVEATGQGLHVSGKPYKNDYHFLFVWRDGKIVKLKEYMDTELVTDVICGGQRPEIQ